MLVDADPPAINQSRPDTRSYSVRGIPSQLPPHRGGSCEAGSEEEEEEEQYQTLQASSGADISIDGTHELL
jgi:hypothetical protein